MTVSQCVLGEQRACKKVCLVTDQCAEIIRDLKPWSRRYGFFGACARVKRSGFSKPWQ